MGTSAASSRMGGLGGRFSAVGSGRRLVMRSNNETCQLVGMLGFTPLIGEGLREDGWYKAGLRITRAQQESRLTPTGPCADPKGRING